MRVRVYLNCEGIRDLAGILDDRNNEIVFQYAPVFIQKKLQLSPFGAPLGTQLIKGKSHARGLPGFIADSLPDGWGNLLLDRQLRRLGLRLDLVSPLERLCWIGRQGMGALEYEPESSLREIKSESIALDVLAEEASLLLQNGDIEELDDLCELNGSSGGERPKIVCLVNEKKQKSSVEHLRTMVLCRGSSNFAVRTMLQTKGYKSTFVPNWRARPVLMFLILISFPQNAGKDGLVAGGLTAHRGESYIQSPLRDCWIVISVFRVLIGNLY